MKTGKVDPWQNALKKIAAVSQRIEDAVAPRAVFQKYCPASEKPKISEARRNILPVKDGQDTVPHEAAWFISDVKRPPKILGKSRSGRNLIVAVTGAGNLSVYKNGRKKARFFFRDEAGLGQCEFPLVLEVHHEMMGASVTVPTVRFIDEDRRELVEELQEFGWGLYCCAVMLKDRIERSGLNVSNVEITPSESRSPVAGKRREQLQKLLLQVCRSIPVSKLESGDIDAFMSAYRRAKKRLKPLSEYMKEFTLHFVGHSHIDLAWKWRWPEALEACRLTFEAQIKNIKKYPGYCFVESSPVAWKALQEKHPKLIDEIKQATANRQWEPVGGMWCETDCNLIDGESWAHHFLHAQRWVEKTTGRRSKIGMNIDAFGFNHNMPGLLSQAGMNGFLTQKLRYNEHTMFPHIVFWWKAPDGAKILAVHTVPDHYQNVEYPMIIDSAKEFELVSGVKDALVLFGVGNHGGGPRGDMFRRIERLQRLDLFPTVRYSSLESYFDTLRNNYASKQFPVYNDELFLETHQRTYTIQSAIKQANRTAERKLTDLEKVWACAAMLGAEPPGETIASIWEKALFQQFHDLLPGTCITSANRDSMEDYSEIFQRARQAMDQAFQSLGSEACGKDFLVFNSLAMKRSAPVFLPDTGNVRICDSGKKNIAIQKVVENGEKKLLFIAHNLPSMGYASYFIGNGAEKQTRRAKKVSAKENRIENRYYRIEVDRETGNISELFDKRAAKSILAKKQQANRLELWQDNQCDKYGTWNYNPTGKYQILDKPVEITIDEAGPVRARIKIKHEVTGEWKKRFYDYYIWSQPGANWPTSTFTQEIMLYADDDLIHFRLHTDWWEEGVMLKVAFPVGVKAKTAAYEIPFSTVRRSTTYNTPEERARNEVPALRWGDLSNRTGGVSLLNKTKHGYDIHGNTLRLTLLSGLKTAAPSSSLTDPMADKGRHTIEYALYPHTGQSQTDIFRKAYDYTTEPIVAQPNKKLSSSFINIKPSSLILTAMKPAEDRRGIIVRLFQTENRKNEAALTFPLKITEAFKTNLIEDDLEQLPASDKTLRFSVGAKNFQTVRVVF